MDSITHPPSAIRNSLSRRDLMKLAASAMLGTSVSGWFKLLARDAGAQPRKHKSCILLWMDGGPPEAYTFSPKESIPPHKAIATRVPGTHISELLPKVAQQVHHCAILRSMSTSDGVHPTARYLMHTGYRKGGAIAYPSVGSIVSAEINPPGLDMPRYVGLAPAGAMARAILGPGHLGARQAPFIVSNPSDGIPNQAPATDRADLDRRIGLVDGLDQDFLKRYQAEAIEAHRAGYQETVRLIHSAKAVTAFKIDEEPQWVRDLYGNTPFGTNCLLARRLVEAGVPFVEVPLGGWDFHGGAATNVKPKAEQLDAPMAALLADLHDRGLLDSTLVIWMGEFGRGPSCNTHYPKAWTTVLAGAGLKVGQVIGQTDPRGAEIVGTTINAASFMATILKAMGIDHAKRYDVGRPIGIVDQGGVPVPELFM